MRVLLLILDYQLGNWVLILIQKVLNFHGLKAKPTS